MDAQQTTSPSPEYALNFSYVPSTEPYVVHIFFGDVPRDIDYERAHEAQSWVGQLCVMAHPYGREARSKAACLRSSIPLRRHLLKHLHTSTPAELNPDRVESFVQQNLQWRFVGVGMGNRKEIPLENIMGELAVVLCGPNSILWHRAV
ncbi:MAG: hypothetical protein M1835_002539 [Candelina submexicana]|nr:MAG: hypothetical protein M1835_002539 [Candelina submexicana]